LIAAGAYCELSRAFNFEELAQQSNADLLDELRRAAIPELDEEMEAVA
jgi:hypothetical protein